MKALSISFGATVLACNSGCATSSAQTSIGVLPAAPFPSTLPSFSAGPSFASSLPLSSSLPLATSFAAPYATQAPLVSSLPYVPSSLPYVPSSLPYVPSSLPYVPSSLPIQPSFGASLGGSFAASQPFGLTGQPYLGTSSFSGNAFGGSSLTGASSFGGNSFSSGNSFNSGNSFDGSSSFNGGSSFTGDSSSFTGQGRLLDVSYVTGSPFSANKPWQSSGQGSQQGSVPSNWQSSPSSVWTPATQQASQVQAQAPTTPPSPRPVNPSLAGRKPSEQLQITKCRSAQSCEKCRQLNCYWDSTGRITSRCIALGLEASNIPVEAGQASNLGYCPTSGQQGFLGVNWLAIENSGAAVPSLDGMSDTAVQQWLSSIPNYNPDSTDSNYPAGTAFQDLLPTAAKAYADGKIPTTTPWISFFDSLNSGYSYDGYSYDSYSYDSPSTYDNSYPSFAGSSNLGSSSYGSSNFGVGVGSPANSNSGASNFGGVSYGASNNGGSYSNAYPTTTQGCGTCGR